ncbi:XdhC family protein [Gryllotalpicola koreensis]|uniref:TRASH domain-containing protein n=1 Tax=Gryllotalpicola koreensis TaxID=993086 RepID=A0ABP8AC45_9MICO
MTAIPAVTTRQRELEEQRQAFVRATVVRTQHPTSARAGDVAVVDALGTMTGFVGGTCVEASVREFSLHALETGEPVLLQVRPGDVGRTESEGAVEVHNPCLSGGSIDVFLEPIVPAAHVVVVGGSPVAQALARLGADAGFEMELVDGESWEPSETDAALIVASHGRGEEPALERALTAGIPYIGLVASGKRGAAVVASLNVPDELRQRVHTPAGLRLGGTAPAEIALGVLAQLVQMRATTGAGESTSAPASASPTTATDPVCHMTVVAADPTPHADIDDQTVWFCSDGCKSAFLSDPSAYAAA